jgi:hypothetical protein
VAEFRGWLRAIGRVAVLVSLYNELVTAKLLGKGRSRAAVKPVFRKRT